jgi:bla regulator protein BlaR1
MADKNRARCRQLFHLAPNGNRACSSGWKGRAVLLAGLLALGAHGGLAQSQILHATGDRPSFEVATIKPWKRAPTPPPDGASAPVKVMKVSPLGGGGQPTNQVQMILPAALLIASAYNLPVGSENRLVRGPDWLRQDTDQYEIQAKIEDSLYAAMQKMTPPQQREQVALMEQSLLADRFKLQVHFETAEMPVYALVAAKGGLKLTSAADGESARLSTVGNEQGMKMNAIAVTLDQFALSPLLTGAAGGRPVLNQTGLKGLYDFTLTWAPEQLAAPEAAKNPAADAPQLFTAIQEQLGLKLIP